MIRSENILKVISNFKKVLPMAIRQDHLDMDETGVNCGHSCGSTHCHAGWYALAACDLHKELCFIDGAHKIAFHLGFFDKEGLKEWAGINENIWGNGYGAKMFVSPYAFYNSEKRPDGAETLSDIIDHWPEVYERVKAVELTTEPPIDELINHAISKEKVSLPLPQ